jgi:hypothetical protein
MDEDRPTVSMEPARASETPALIDREATAFLPGPPGGPDTGTCPGPAVMLGPAPTGRLGNPRSPVSTRLLSRTVSRLRGS